MKKKEKSVLAPAAVSEVCMQLAFILESGMALEDGVGALADESEKDGLQPVCQALCAGLNETGSLCEAMRRSAAFPAYAVEMAGVGETTGRLEAVLRGLADYYEREARMREAITDATVYPIALGAMLVVIVLVMLCKVLPVFRRVLGGMGVGAADAGGALITLGAWLGWIVMALVGLAVLAALGCALALRTQARERVLRLLRRVFPQLRRIEAERSAVRAALALSRMLSSGFGPEEAAATAASVLEDGAATARMKDMRQALEEGEAFSDALERSGLFQPRQMRMIRAGAQAGRGAQVLEKLAADYEEAAESEIARIVSIIEPTLIALLSIVVGGILLSVMLPMARMLTSLT